MSEPLDVVAINLEERAAVFNDSKSGPITDMFDIDGEDTTDPESVVAIIVIHPEAGRFFVELPDEFTSGLVQ